MVQYKLLYRFYCLRHYALGINTSGYYPKSIIRQVADLYNLSYNTLRGDLKKFERKGFIAIHGDNIRLLKNNNSYWRLFTDHLDEYLNESKPENKFAARVLKNQLHGYLYSQALKESENIENKSIRRKYLSCVRKGINVGEKQGIHAGLRAIGRHFDRSFVTAYRYVLLMKKVGLKVHKHYHDWGPRSEFFKNDMMYGRIFVSNDRVIERSLNSYSF
jgi:hypothetical protein